MDMLTFVGIITHLTGCIAGLVLQLVVLYIESKRYFSGIRALCGCLGTGNADCSTRELRRSRYICQCDLCHSRFRSHCYAICCFLCSSGGAIAAGSRKKGQAAQQYQFRWLFHTLVLLKATLPL